MISGVIALFNFLAVLNKKIEYRSNAYKLVDSTIEQYRDSDFGTLADGTTQIDANGLPQGGRLSTTISSDIEGPGQTDIRQITVTVSWNFKGPQNVRMSTYITRGGIQL